MAAAPVIRPLVVVTMSASLTIGLAELDTSRFAAERLLVDRVRAFVDASGIAAVLAEHGQVSFTEALDLFEARLHFALLDPVRVRMIRVLFDFLVERGELRPGADGHYTFRPQPPQASVAPPGEAPVGAQAAESVGQLAFFERCLQHAAPFLHGHRPLFDFDAASAPAWEGLLGNSELRLARGILARLVLPRDRRASDGLVLCYGPGFDLAEIEARCPATRLTALDFTDAFRPLARRRLQAPDRVAWPDAASWGGFGRPLPFDEDSFDFVTLTCADPYIPRDCRLAVFEDLRRVLRPGGVLGLLTHSYPDPARLAVSNSWIRLATYCHDFLESVCRGWQGFSDAESLRQLLARARFHVDLVTHNASVWRLSKPRLPGAVEQ